MKEKLSDYRKQKEVPRCKSPADTKWEKMMAKIKAKIKDRWESSWILKQWEYDPAFFTLIAIMIPVVSALLWSFAALVVSNIREAEVEPKRTECAVICKELGAQSFRIEGKYSLDFIRMVHYAGDHCQCACNIDGKVEIAPWNDGWEGLND